MLKTYVLPMRSKSYALLSRTILLIMILGISLPYSANAEEPDTNLVLNWLSPGALPISKPAFHHLHNVSGKEFGMPDFFRSIQIPSEDWWPAANDPFKWPGLENTFWKTYKANRHGIIEINTPGQEKLNYALGIGLAYLKTDIFSKINIVFSSSLALQVLHNGVECCKSTTADKTDGRFNAKATLSLEPGTHIILVKSIYSGEENKQAWTLKTLYTINKGNGSSISNPTSAVRHKDLTILLEGVRVNAAKPSYDGTYYLLQLEETQAGSGRKEEWTEIWKTTGPERVANYRNMSARGMEWSPVRNELCYRTRENDKSAVWILSLQDQSSRKVLSIKDLDQVEWAPDGASLFYSITEQQEEKNDGVQRIAHMPGRWPWWKKRSFIHHLDLKSLTSQRLTWGQETTQLMDIHPDGHTLLIATSKPEFSERPFSKQVIMTLNIHSLHIDTLFSSPFSVLASFSPDGNKLLLTSSPSLFNGLGSALSEEKIPNDYDTQLYLYDLISRKATPLSLTFDPSINQAFWSKFDNKIYLLVTEKTYKRLYSYDINTKQYNLVQSIPDVITQLSLSSKSPSLCYVGSSISTAPKAYIYNIKTGNTMLLSDPEAESMKHVTFGKTYDWNFTMPHGEIEGRVYLPPDFNPEKKYPVIVHYYGGTSPVDRSFRGRYPKNYFAAHGYVVYVLQPSGATGYGQEFSSQHVNNWGRTVSKEIITCTKEFLKAHPFADSTRVGCIGASYGGFMTMLLLSETDLFATGIAHAGISSISSYWGEGFWGYLYSAAASANSYPWNNPELYIGQSPLFKADKINTPLLLLHGKDDDNVPPGESIQLFTALKILGKDVELIEIEGQGHHVMDFAKRSKWQKSIMAWFAKYLQDEPAWWEELYPGE